MLHTRFFQARFWISLVLGLGALATAVSAPLALQAQARSMTQTITSDVKQMQTLLNNAFFLELASEACAARAVDLHVVAICTAIHTNQVQQVANAKFTLTYLTGVRPWNPTLSATDQATITHLLFDPFATQSSFVTAFGNALVGKFQNSIETAALCAGIGFAPSTQHFCSTLGPVDAGQDNAIQNYMTQTLGNVAKPKSH